MGKFDLTGKCILITGASSGLGAHFAELASQAGAAVALAARRTDRINEQCEKINNRGGRAFAVHMDVCEGESIVKAVKQVEEEFLPVDVLVNNAGIAITKTFLETDEDDWNRLVDTNLIGLASVARVTAKYMKQREHGGVIINIGSTLGKRPGNMAAAYASTKAGVIHLSRGMSLELARYGIRVNTILPGVYPNRIGRAEGFTESY
jgi:3-oxoacyl-[acyl-carrier protein] reductase